MLDLAAVMGAFDRAVAGSSGIAPVAAVNRAADRARELRRRLGLQGDVTVVALAGGTGTGKSSLLNAVAGSEVASVSAVRPHTDQPLAWIPESGGPALDELLEIFGVGSRVLQESQPGLALIDLPDMDSVEAEHRRRVEDLIVRVDRVLWVVDPVKYRDPRLFEDFLEPLSRYRDHFTFVLNKVDLLAAQDREAVLADLRSALEAAGHQRPRVLLTAARPALGAPEGISVVRAALAGVVKEKRAVVRKWLIDLKGEIEAIARAGGVWGGASVDFEERWQRDRDAVVAGMTADGGGAVARADAACRLEDLVAMIAVEVGPLTGAPIRQRFAGDAVERVLDEATEAAEKARGEEGARRAADERARAAAGAAVDALFGGPLRAMLDGRARFGALVAEADLAATGAIAALDAAEGE